MISTQVEVTSHVEPGLDHYSESVAELHRFAAWLRRAFFGDAVEVTYRDRPSAPAARFDDVLLAPLPAWWRAALAHGRRQPCRLHADEVAHMPPEWRPVFGL